MIKMVRIDLKRTLFEIGFDKSYSNLQTRDVSKKIKGGLIN